MTLTKVTNRMTSGAVVNVLDYGAKGDGSTIDTGSISAALSDALSTGRALYFPTGNYIIDDEFTVNIGPFKSVKIYGEFSKSQYPSGVSITQTNSTKGVFILGDATLSSSLTDIIIDGIRFVGTNSGSGSAITMYKTSTSQIVNCQFWYWGYYGIYMSGTKLQPNYDIEISNCRFTQNDTVNIFGDEDAVNILTIKNCNIQNISRLENVHGIQVSGFVINISDNTIQTLSDAIRIDQGYNINIENNYMENFGGYAVRLAQTNLVSGLKIKGNHIFNGSTAGLDLIYCAANPIYGAELSGNTMWAATSPVRNKYSFANCTDFQDVVVMPVNQDDPSADYVWPSGITPNYIGNSLSSKTMSETLSGDISISQQNGNVFYLDPNGSNRNVAFTGNFILGTKLQIINTGAAFNLIMTGYSSYEITPSTTVTFEYTSTGWTLGEITGRQTETSLSSGTFTIKSLTGSSANMTGFIQIQPNIWVPYTLDPSP